MHFYVILKSLPISDDRGPSSFEGTSTVLRLKFMYVSSFDSINIRRGAENYTHFFHKKKINISTTIYSFFPLLSLIERYLSPLFNEVIFRFFF